MLDSACGVLLLGAGFWVPYTIPAVADVGLARDVLTLRSMGAKHFRELAAWQLANELRHAVIELTSRQRLSVDLKFRDQIRASSSSVCSNIAEGFTRFRHREFARFLVIARGSLAETQDQLEDALGRGYLSRQEFDPIWKLTERAMGATTKLLTYLRSCDSPRRSRH